MTITWEQSYAGQMRMLVGHRKMIVPAIRAVILNGDNQVLLIKRVDNGRWALPAGSVELDESVMDTVRREVREETGLEVLSATLFAIYSEARYQFTNSHGDEYQVVVSVFRVDSWGGALVTRTDETTDARFFALDALPEISAMYRETLDDLARFAGTVFIK